MRDALRPDDTRDALRKIGVLLFGIGVLMLLIRKGNDWDKFPIFLALAIPAVTLYGAGVLTVKDTEGLQPWQAVASVFGLIFVPLALFQFIEVVDGSASNLNTFWIFGLTAALALFAGIVAGIRFHLLAAGIALIVSWSALWDKILGEDGIGGSIGTYRALLGALALLLLALGVFIWRSDRGDGRRDRRSDGRDDGLLKFSELVTGAGIAALIACGLGITSADSDLASFTGIPTIETTMVWDVLLLVVSVGLIAIGSQIGTRGPVYLGAIGLLVFLFIVGADLNDESPEPNKLGIWPLLLIIGGGAAIAASLSRGVSLGNRPRDSVRRLSGR